LNWFALRYFNVIVNGVFSESYDHSPETLLPSNARNLAQSNAITVYGMSHATADGTQARDYVDARDIAEAQSPSRPYS